MLKLPRNLEWRPPRRSLFGAT